MPKISAVGLFCCDKFEETPKQKVIDLSKFKKIYFNKAQKPDLVFEKKQRFCGFEKIDNEKQEVKSNSYILIPL